MRPTPSSHCQYQELEATGRAMQLTAVELKGRVLMKGKIKLQKEKVQRACESSAPTLCALMPSCVLRKVGLGASDACCSLHMTRMAAFLKASLAGSLRSLRSGRQSSEAPTAGALEGTNQAAASKATEDFNTPTTAHDMVDGDEDRFSEAPSRRMSNEISSDLLPGRLDAMVSAQSCRRIQTGGNVISPH
eukprot:2607356-Prymnesium_polylepis.2